MSENKITLPVTGMTCANCAMNIERVLKKKIEGVSEASVNFATERADIVFDQDITDINNIVAAIEKAGYGAIIPDENIEDEETEAREREMLDQKKKFLVGLLFTIPLFALSMGRDFSLIGAMRSG
jgi:Cu+-exporting ATPase